MNKSSTERKEATAAADRLCLLQGNHSSQQGFQQLSSTSSWNVSCFAFFCVGEKGNLSILTGRGYETELHKSRLSIGNKEQLLLLNNQ